MTIENRYTAFDIFYVDGRVNYRLLFGAPDRTIRMDRSRSIALFAQNKTVGYLRWRANEYGTQVWRCFVVRTVAAGDEVTHIPGVKPAAHILLSTRGKTYTKRFLGRLDGLKKRNHALEHVPDAYWRHLHLRVYLNLDPHPLTDNQWATGRVKHTIRS
ncbi:MAG: DUF2840 domain-containing protein [Pseudomonadota bacterium]